MTGFFDLTEGGKVNNWVPASLGDSALQPKFQHWRDGFENSNAGQFVLRKLDDELQFVNPMAYSAFLDEGLFGGWCAFENSRYKNSPNTLNHRIWRREVELASKQIDDIDKLTSRLDRQPEIVGSSIEYRTTEDGGIEPATVDFRESLDQRKFQLSILRERAQVLAKSGREAVGCLLYGENVKGQNPPADEVALGLAFELAMRIRCYTSKSADIGDGSMPSYGKPHYRIVAQLLSAILQGNHIPSLETEKDEAKRLSRQIRKFRFDHPQARWGGWQIKLSSNSPNPSIGSPPTDPVKLEAWRRRRLMSGLSIPNT